MSPRITANRLAYPVVHRVINYLAWALLLIAGICSAGILLDHVGLTMWSPIGLPITAPVTVSMLLLSAGAACANAYHHHSVRPEGYGRVKFYAAVTCFALVCILSFGYQQDYAHRPMQLLMIEEQHNTWLKDYRILIWFSAGIISLVELFSPRKSSKWCLWGIQVPALVLFCTAFIAFVPYFQGMPQFRYAMSLPASLGLMIYSTILLLSRSDSTPLMQPFFSSSLKTKVYSMTLILGWVILMMWQVYIWHYFLLQLSLDSTIRYQIDLLGYVLGGGFAALSLGLGMNVLGTLERNHNLLNRLQDAFSSYTVLAATLSHDLKAPIETEIEAIDMVRTGQLGGEIPERARKILLAVNESNRFELELVCNLVELLRYEVKEERFQPEWLSLSDTLCEIAEELVPFARCRQQELEIEPIKGSCVTVFADSVGLKRVFYNLINNAIKHLGPGCKISVAVEALADVCLFSIRDNGPGIPGELQARLFERFQSHSGKMTSSGLGLFVSRQIVNRHGGDIWVESQPGQGCTFYFTLPWKTEDQPGREASTVQIHYPSLHKATHRPSILLS